MAGMQFVLLRRCSDGLINRGGKVGKCNQEAMKRGCISGEKPNVGQRLGIKPPTKDPNVSPLNKGMTFFQMKIRLEIVDFVDFASAE
jgi:hypothetical protein